MTRSKDAIRQEIKEFIKNHPNPSFIYGGQTCRTVHQRHLEHINEDKRFEGAIKVEITSTKYKHKIDDLEKMLIDMLFEAYGSKVCYNTRNMDGNGSTSNKEKHILYILYKD